MRDPVNSQFMAESNAFILEVTYDEELEIIDPNEKIGISFVSEHIITSPMSKGEVFSSLSLLKKKK